MNDSATLTGITFDIFALVAIFLAIYVMQKAEHDRRTTRLDPIWLRLVRRPAFVFAALALCYSIFSEDWHPGIPGLLLIIANVLLLTVNAMSLYLRNPPINGPKVYVGNRSVVRHLGNYAWRLISLIRVSR